MKESALWRRRAASSSTTIDYGGDGRIEKANCVVPTTQNNGNIHRDLPDFVRRMVDEGVNDDQRLELLCSMLVRSYDPCVSCSVH